MIKPKAQGLKPKTIYMPKAQSLIQA